MVAGLRLFRYHHGLLPYDALHSHKQEEQYVFSSNSSSSYNSSFFAVDSFKVLKDSKDSQISIEFMERAPDNNSERFAELIQKLKACGNRIGVLVTEKQSQRGNLTCPWYEKLDAASYLKQVDIGKHLSELLSVKSQDEVADIKRASTFISLVMKKFFRENMEVIIDEDKEITHAKFADQTENIILEPSKSNISALQKVGLE